MEELDSCIKEWLHNAVETYPLRGDIELLKYWIYLTTEQYHDANIKRCTAYVEQFGWNDLNSRDYKYFANESLSDVVSRKLALFAEKYLIALS